MTAIATITPSTSAPVETADWKDKPVSEMTASELMAIAVMRYPEAKAIPAIVELMWRAERATWVK